MFKPGDQPIAGYKLIHFLGKGQFGEVWKASGPGGTEVALKFILLQQRTGIRELKSIQSVKLIRHANLLPVHAIWLLGMDGTVLDDAMLDQLLSDKPIPEGTIALDVTQTLDNPQYLVVSMALADKSLEDLLKEAGGEGISHVELLDFMRQAAKGIDFLNSPRHLVNGQKVGIQHRDIKPANLLVSGDSLLIGDFGVAAAFGEYDTEATSVVGSLCYMSPESIKRMPSHSSDQYALAITYYQLRANALPFEKTVSFAELVEIHIGGKLDFSRATAHEQAVLSRATSTDPKKRYATCAEFIADLEGAVTEAQPVAPRRRAAVTGVIFVMAAIAATVAFLSEGTIWHLGGGNQGDVPLPQPVTHKLTFEPPGTRFMIHLLGDADETPEPIEGQDAAMITLRDDQRISIDAALPSSLYLPLQEAYSVDELRSKAWNITLARKEPSVIRAESETALREGDDTQAIRLYRLALEAMPDEFRPEALFATTTDSVPALRASVASSGLGTFLSSGEGKGWLNQLIPPNEQDGWQLDKVSWGPLPSAYIVHAESGMLIEIHDREVQVNDPKTGRAQQTLDLGLPVPEIPYPQILAHAISPDQRWLLIGQDDGRVRLASISSSDAKLELVAEVALPQSVAAMVAFEESALAIDRSGNALLLPLPVEVNDRESLTAFEEAAPAPLEINQEEILGAISIADPACYLVTEAHVYRTVFDGASRSLQAIPVMEIRGYPQLIRKLSGNRVAITTDLPNRALAILDEDEQPPVWLGSPEIGGVTEDLTHSPDGRWLVLTDLAGELMAIDLQATPPQPISLRQPDRRRIKYVGFHDDSNVLVMIFESGEIECWDFPGLLLSALAR